MGQESENSWNPKYADIVATIKQIRGESWEKAQVGSEDLSSGRNGIGSASLPGSVERLDWRLSKPRDSLDSPVGGGSGSWGCRGTFTGCGNCGTSQSMSIRSSLLPTAAGGAAMLWWAGFIKWTAGSQSAAANRKTLELFTQELAAGNTRQCRN